MTGVSFVFALLAALMFGIAAYAGPPVNAVGGIAWIAIAVLFSWASLACLIKDRGE